MNRILPKSQLYFQPILWSLIILFIFAPSIPADIIRSNGTGGGNWSEFDTWQGGTIPSNADTVIIASGDTVTLDLSTTIARLVFESGLRANALKHQSSSEILNVNGDVLLNTPSANGQEQSWNIDSGMAVVSGNVYLTLAAGAGNGTRIVTVHISNGSLTVDSLIYQNTDGGDNQTRVLISGNGSIDLAGSIELGTSNGTLDCGTTGRFNFTGTTDQTVRQTGAGLIYYHDVYIQGGNSRTVILDANLDQLGTGRITGSLYIENGIFDARTYSIVLSTGETFAVRNEATFTTQAADPNAFPSADSIQLDSTSTVIYHRNGDQTISAQTYGHLSIISPNTATRTYTLASNITLRGNLTVQQTGGFPAILELGTNTITANHSDSLFLGPNTRLDISGASNFPDQFGYFDLNMASEVQYEATTLNQSIKAASQTTGETISYGRLDLRGGQTGGYAKIAAGPLDVNGDLDLGFGGGRNAIINLGNFTHTFSGNWNNDGGSIINFGQSTVIFDGGYQTITAGNFYNVIFSGTDIKTIATSFNAENDLIIESNVTVDPNSIQITIGGDWQNEGLFTPNSGQNTIFDGSDQLISVSNFANLFISGSGQKTATGRLQISNELEINSSLLATDIITVGGNLDINGVFVTQDSLVIQGSTDIANTASFTAGGPIISGGSFNINNGTFSAGSFTHYCAGNWIQDGLATINRGTSTWIFNGTNQSITRGLFYDAVFTHGETKTLLTNFDFDHNLTIDNGVNLSSTASGTLGGDLVINGSGTFTITGSLTLDGADQYIGPLTVFNLILGGTGTKYATGNFDINGSVFVYSTFDAGSFSHTVAVNWSGYGTFIPSSSTIIFDSGDSDITKDESFYNLTLNSTGGDAALDNGTAANPTRITIFNDLHLINGEFRIHGISGTELAIGGNLTIENNTDTGIQFNSANITLEIGGNFQNFNNLGGINDGLTSIDGTENFVFNGSGNIQLRTSGFPLPNITINKFNGSVNLNDTLTITRSVTLTAGVLHTSNTNILFLNSTAGIVGGSESSYINGPMVQVVGTAGTRIYTLGHSGFYRPIEFYLNSISTNPALKVALQSGSPGGDTDTTTLDTISDIRYYQTEVVNSGLINSATAKIHFGNDDGVTDLQNTVIAHSPTQTGLYTSLGRSASNGTASNGTITSDVFDLNENSDFLVLGFEKVKAVKLKIVEILPNPIVVNEDFQVTIQAQNRGGNPANVSTNTDISLTRILTGTGSLTGNTTGTILAGQSQVTISGVRYGIAEYLQIEASRTSGDLLSSDTSQVIQAASAFYSNVDRNGNPAVNTNWNTERDGSGSPPAAGALAGLFIIQANDTMRTVANFSEYDIVLRIENGGAFFNNTGTTELGSLFIEGGGLVRANSEIEISSNGNFTIYDNGTYIHNNTARLDEAEALYAGTENFAENSHFTVLQLSTIASSLNTFSQASFGNLTLNLTTNTANLSFNGNLTDVKGDLLIESTGTGRIEFSDNDTENYVLAIGRDFRITGGTIYLMDANAQCTINIGNDWIISGGEIRVTDGTGDPIIDIGNNLVITGGTLNLSAVTGGVSTVYLRGNLTHSNGTISETAGGSGTIIFNGSAPQIWSAGGTISGNAVNFNLNNYQGLTLSGNHVQLTGTLTLTNGLFTTSDGSMLIVSTTGNISGGNSSSFINGPMAHSWTTATATKNYPIGANGVYRPLELSLTTPASPVIKAQLFNSPPNGTPDNSPLVRISQVRYYQTTILSGSAGSNNARVKLTWGSDDGVGDLPRMVVARSTVVNGIYSSLSQSAVSGDSLNGSVTSQNFTLTSSPGSDFLALGTTNADVSLPVQLAIFEARPINNSIRIVWRSESELENAFWILERANLEDSSQVGLPASQLFFQEIYRIPGQGNSTTACDYEFVDVKVVSGNWYRYRLLDVSFNGEINYHPDIAVRANVPLTFALLQNYPNPFNPRTTISFTLPAPTPVTLTIYDAVGREIKKIVDRKNFDIGLHLLEWDGKDRWGNQVASGIYFYRLETTNHWDVKKMVLLK